MTSCCTRGDQQVLCKNFKHQKRNNARNQVGNPRLAQKNEGNSVTRFGSDGHVHEPMIHHPTWVPNSEIKSTNSSSKCGRNSKQRRINHTQGGSDHVLPGTQRKHHIRHMWVRTARHYHWNTMVTTPQPRNWLEHGQSKNDTMPANMRRKKERDLRRSQMEKSRLMGSHGILMGQIKIWRLRILARRQTRMRCEAELLGTDEGPKRIF